MMLNSTVRQNEQIVDIPIVRRFRTCRNVCVYKQV